MLVVIPVCEKDFELCQLNLELTKKLDGKQDFLAVISCEKEFKQTDTIVKLARKAFKQVELFKYDRKWENAPWPRPQNHAWQQAARHVEGRDCWFWWEADAVPLCRGWLKTIAFRYKKEGKPFLGHFVESMGHMNGVGVWPKDVQIRVPHALFCKDSAFDVIAGPVTGAQMARGNDLILHHLKEQGARSFVTKEEVKKLGGVLFHGCDDGSLHRLLLEQAKPLHFSDKVKVVHNALPVVAPKHQVIHCMQRWNPKDKDTKARIAAARESWKPFWNLGVKPVSLWRYPREINGLPFLKDVLRLGLDASGPHDFILLTNDDTILHPMLFNVLEDREVACSFRTNFRSSDEIDLVPEGCNGGFVDAGRDLFWFHKPWLQKHWSKIADMLMACADWDFMLALLIREYFWN